ncbi:aldose epimerase family protein [Microbacterium plantarum]|uniref:hypothetical protein n=1 Tax=Microbacterium plantarum TaxID=1816425 RepID=UPI002B48C974|nr:hypothetical protein [Microbacterium plantarum]WRK16148.1 hypothetical protein VC184_09460 [Microbacterium plantarum]
MNGLRGDVDEAVREYVAQPANFGVDTNDLRAAEGDAFRAAVKWTLDNADWRVLAGFIPGALRVTHLRVGDVVVAQGVTGTVISIVPGARATHFVVRTEGGAEIVLERQPSERVAVRETAAMA